MSDLTGLSTSDWALLRSVFSWARFNGWRYQLKWEEPGRDYDGAPNDSGARRHRWSRPIEGEEQENEVEVYVDVDTERVVSVLFRPDDSDSGLWWGGETAITYGVQGIVDSLVAVSALPVHFSSAFAAGRESLLHVPNDIEATGGCCCNGCIGEGPCDLDPFEEPEGAADNALDRLTEMTAEEREGYGDL